VNQTCLICEAPCPPRAENSAYPFCSRRCQLVDLGRWLDGAYHIPGEPLEDLGQLDGQGSEGPRPGDGDEGW
jgi:uncharacterized protein